MQWQLLLQLHLCPAKPSGSSASGAVRVPRLREQGRSRGQELQMPVQSMDVAPLSFSLLQPLHGDGRLLLGLQQPALRPLGGRQTSAGKSLSAGVFAPCLAERKVLGPGGTGPFCKPEEDGRTPVLGRLETPWHRLYFSRGVRCERSG